MRAAAALLLFLAATAHAGDIALAPAEYAPYGPWWSRVSAAAVGGTWLTAWTDNDTRLAFARIDAEGRLVDVPSRLVAFADSFETDFYHCDLDVVGAGDRWILFAGGRAWIVRSDGAADTPRVFGAARGHSAAASNGHRIAYVYDQTLRILDRDLTVLSARPLSATVQRVAIADDGSGIALTDDSRIIPFDASGTPGTPRSVSSTPIKYAVLACDGDRYLLGWPVRGSGIVVTVVDRAGNTIAAPHVIAATDFDTSDLVVAASNGRGWTIAYARQQNRERRLGAIDVAPDGAAIGQPLTMISMSDASWLRSFDVYALVSNGSRLLLLHREWSGAPLGAILFRSLDDFAAHQEIDAVSTSAMWQGGLAVAPAGKERFLAIWYEQVRAAAFFYYDAEHYLPRNQDDVVRVRVAAITPGGVTEPLELGRAPVDRGWNDDWMTTAGVASNGSIAAVAWQYDGKLMAAIVTNDGALVTVPRPIANTVAQTIAIAWNGTAFQIVWTDYYGQAWAALLNGSGVAGDAIALTVDPYGYHLSKTYGLSVACGGGECVTAWADGDYPPPFGEVPPPVYDLYVVRFDSAGHASRPAQTSRLPGELPLVFVDEHGAASLIMSEPGAIAGTRLSRDGKPLDATKDSVGTPLTPSNGYRYHYAIGAFPSGYFALENTFDGRYMRLPQHLLASGVAFQPRPQLLGTTDLGVVAVADYGNTYTTKIVTAARNDTRAFIVVGYGVDDPRYLTPRLFIRDLPTSSHRRAAP